MEESSLIVPEQDPELVGEETPSADEPVGEETISADEAVGEETISADETVGEETISADESVGEGDRVPLDDHLFDPDMYEPVQEVSEGINRGKKRKLAPNSQNENGPQRKKCRAVYGTTQKELWCKPCQSKRKCTKFKT